MTVPGVRCEQTDLLVSQCAHCQTRVPRPPVVVPRDTLGFGQWFIAQFESDCDGDCGGVIEAGDSCRSDGEGGWLCQVCGADD